MSIGMIIFLCISVIMWIKAFLKDDFSAFRFYVLVDAIVMGSMACFANEVSNADFYVLSCILGVDAAIAVMMHHDQ